jgi:hypothetical protein
MGIDYSRTIGQIRVEGWSSLARQVDIWSRGYRLRHMGADPSNRIVALSAMEVVLGTYSLYPQAVG